MSPIFLGSYFALWALFLLQSIVVLALLRQIGVLHIRIAPAGARITAAGPQIGHIVPTVTLEDMDDPRVRRELTQTMAKDLLLLFVSPSCSMCASLMPAVKALARDSQSDMDWVVVSFGGYDECGQFRRHYGLDFLLFAYAPDIRDQYRITVTPYAVLVNREGVVLSKGLVNHMEHLESLFSARAPARGSDSTEETMQARELAITLKGTTNETSTNLSR